MDNFKIYVVNLNSFSHSLPKTTKDAVDEVILKAVERNPANGNLGCPQRFSQTLQASKRSRERSSSSSSTEMQVMQLFRIY